MVHHTAETAFRVCLSGQLTKLTLGQRMIDLGQRLLLHVPLVSSIYSTCKQIADAMRTSSGGVFRQAVMFEYPRPGSYTIGFVTNENQEGNELTEKLGKQLVSVFIPTTPNPTSGFLLLIPREDCMPYRVKVEESVEVVRVADLVRQQNPQFRQERLIHMGK